MLRPSKLAFLASAVALAFVSGASQASIVFTTPSLTGNVSVTGFSDVATIAGPDGIFKATFSNLAGSVNALALPNGSYDVSVQGSAKFTGYPGGVVEGSTASPLLLFSGALSSTGLTAGPYAFTFPIPAVPNNTHTLLGSFGFSISYDGSLSDPVFQGLQSLGFPFTDPTGAGTLGVSGSSFSDGITEVVFTESNLTWSGFERLLYGVDAMYGGHNGTIDGPFVLTDFTVTAVPEPGTLALAGLALTGLGVFRRRKL